jgi:hypothetical protein
MYNRQMAADIRDVNDWLNAFPARDVERRIRELEGHAAVIEAELNSLRRVHNTWAHMARDDSRDSASTSPDNGRDVSIVAASEAKRNGQTPAQKPLAPSFTKREAIFKLMNEQPLSPWKLADLRQALVDRGWIDDDKKSKHAFDVALSQMHKRGIIDRVAAATYRLASANGSHRESLAKATSSGLGGTGG